MAQKRIYYCGAKKLPRGRRQGTQSECTSSKQLRLYGILSIKSPVSIPYNSQVNKTPSQNKKKSIDSLIKPQKSPRPLQPFQSLKSAFSERPRRQRTKTMRYGF